MRLCRLGELNALYKRVKYCNMSTVWKKEPFLWMFVQKDRDSDISSLISWYI